MKLSFDEIRYLSFVTIVDEDGFVDTSNLIEKPLYYFVNNEANEGIGFWTKTDTSKGSVAEIISEYIEKSFMEEYHNKVDPSVSLDYLRELLVGTDQQDLSDFEEENEANVFICESWARDNLKDYVGKYATWSIMSFGLAGHIDGDKITIDGEKINELDDVFSMIESSRENTFVIIK